MSVMSIAIVIHAIELDGIGFGIDIIDAWWASSPARPEGMVSNNRY